MKRSKTDSALITLFCLIFGFIIFAFASVSQAEAVTLTWEQPDDSRVTGYEVYVGLEKPLPLFTVVDGIDTTSCNIPDLLSHTEYQFMARSIDAAGNRSEPSEYLHYTTASEPVDNIILRIKSPTGLSAED